MTCFISLGRCPTGSAVLVHPLTALSAPVLNSTSSRLEVQRRHSILDARYWAPQAVLSHLTLTTFVCAALAAWMCENRQPSKKLGTFRHLSGLSLGEVSGPQNRPKRPTLLSLPLQYELPRTSSSCSSAMLCSGGSIWAAGWWLSPFRGLVAP